MKRRRPSNIFAFHRCFHFFPCFHLVGDPKGQTRAILRRMSTNQTGSCSGLRRSLCSCRALEMMQSHQITEKSWQLHHGRHIEAWNHFEVTRSKHLSIPVAFQSLKEVPSIPPARSSQSKKVKAKLNPNAQ